MKRKICFVTGSRAEYGLLKPLIEELCRDRDIKAQLIITGAHLSGEFGFTCKEIERDGFRIDEKVKILNGSDSPVAVSESLARAISGCARAYMRLKPDIVTLLGDRYEIFAAAAAAHIAGFPIAHIHGGELSEGVYDDAFRHSITKMSQLHFAAAEEYRRRIIQLGESPERVFTVGALGVSSIKSLRLLSRKELEKELGVRFKSRNLLITFHPPTLDCGESKPQFKELLNALDERKDTLLIFTKANADSGGRVINAMIEAYVAKNSSKAKAFASMGRAGYLSTMKIADGIVGNSSSGIIEAPSLKIGSVNIGDRQKGRIRAASVIDCAPTSEDIRTALKRLYSAAFRRKLKNVVNPYSGRGTAKAIKKVLKNCNLNKALKKDFYDVMFTGRGGV